MPHKRLITTHRDGSAIHAEFSIEAVGDHDYKIVSRHTADTIRFHHGGPGTTPGVVNGLTREILATVLIDSLMQMQEELPCDENAHAIHHFSQGLLALQRRAGARLEQGVVGTMTAHKSSIPDEPSTQQVGRILLNASTVAIGESILNRSELANTWKPWTDAESALKGLSKPPATTDEINFLGQVPLTNAARGGYSEMRQALGQTK